MSECIRCGQCCLCIALPFDNTDVEAVQWIEARFDVKLQPNQNIVLIPHRCTMLIKNESDEYECIAFPKPERCINFPEPGESLLPGCGYGEKQ